MKKRKLENKTMDGFIIYIKTYELEASIWDMCFLKPLTFAVLVRPLSSFVQLYHAPTPFFYTHPYATKMSLVWTAK